MIPLTLEQLPDRLVAWGEPAFRAKQVWTQLLEENVGCRRVYCLTTSVGS